DQFLECLVEQRQGLGFGAIGDKVAIPEHPRPLQDVDDRQRLATTGEVKNFATGVVEPDHQLLVNPQGGVVAVLYFRAQLTVDLAAGDSFPQHVAYGWLQRSHGIRQAQAGFKIAMIDRADFPHQDSSAETGLPSSEGGHAQYHKRTPWELG